MVISTVHDLLESWGYGGIVAGLLLMGGALVVWMEIVYARARKGLDGMDGLSDSRQDVSETIH